MVHPKKFGLMQVLKDEHFAPIKKDEDIPKACVKLSYLHKRWLVDYAEIKFDDIQSISFNDFYHNDEKIKEKRFN